MASVPVVAHDSAHRKRGEIPSEQTPARGSAGLLSAAMIRMRECHANECSEWANVAHWRRSPHRGCGARGYVRSSHRYPDLGDAGASWRRAHRWLPVDTIMQPWRFYPQQCAGGGFLDRYTYVLNGGSTCVVNATAGGAGGFGYVVSHARYVDSCAAETEHAVLRTGADCDDSPWAGVLRALMRPFRRTASCHSRFRTTCVSGPHAPGKSAISCRSPSSGCSPMAAIIRSGRSLGIGLQRRQSAAGRAD